MEIIRILVYIGVNNEWVLLLLKKEWKLSKYNNNDCWEIKSRIVFVLTLIKFESTWKSNLTNITNVSRH